MVFNKAALMNAGYREATIRGWNVDCVLFHDVDVLIEDDRCIFRCGKHIIHYTKYINKFGYRYDFNGSSLLVTNFASVK